MRIDWTEHLIDLVGQSEAAAVRLALAPVERRAAAIAAARGESARLSARLDASPLTPETAAEVLAREAAGLPTVDGLPERPGSGSGSEATGGWARVLRLDGMQTQQVAAVEYANLLACFDVEAQVAETFLERPLEGLARLHAELCGGLVAPEVLGRPRRTVQAVHDGAQGSVLYRAARPSDVAGLLHELAQQITRRAAGLPTLALAGAVHERLLDLQPFEAGNGRLARSASRVVLRARGLDPDGLAVTERGLAADPTGYHAEVAATRRRGDLSLWLERYGEALVSALEGAAEALAPQPRPALPQRARAVADPLAPGEALTVRQYAERAGISVATARGDLRLLARAGIVELEPRSRGLRYRRTKKFPMRSAG